MQVIITPKAQKQYEHLPKVEKIKIKKKLLQIEQNPLSGKKLSTRLLDLRSLRAWPYRILYLIDVKQNKIFIVTIAHRQGVYK